MSSKNETSESESGDNNDKKNNSNNVEIGTAGVSSIGSPNGNGNGNGNNANSSASARRQLNAHNAPSAPSSNPRRSSGNPYNNNQNHHSVNLHNSPLALSIPSSPSSFSIPMPYLPVLNPQHHQHAHQIRPGAITPLPITDIGPPSLSLASQQQQQHHHQHQQHHYHHQSPQPPPHSPSSISVSSSTFHPNNNDININSNIDDNINNYNYNYNSINTKTKTAIEHAINTEKKRIKNLESHENDLLSQNKLSSSDFKLLLKKERNRNVQLVGELTALKSQAVASQAEAEVCEEGRIMGLMRRLDSLQKEKGRIIVELEREEEMLTNTLQKKLFDARKSSMMMEKQIEREHAYNLELRAKLDGLSKSQNENTNANANTNVNTNVAGISSSSLSSTAIVAPIRGVNNVSASASTLPTVTMTMATHNTAASTAEHVKRIEKNDVQMTSS
jgi:hypothetical protein